MSAFWSLTTTIGIIDFHMGIAIIDVIAFSVIGKSIRKNKDMNTIPGLTKFRIGIKGINNILTSFIKLSANNAIINIHKP